MIHIGEPAVTEYCSTLMLNWLHSYNRADASRSRGGRTEHGKGTAAARGNEAPSAKGLGAHTTWFSDAKHEPQLHFPDIGETNPYFSCFRHLGAYPERDT